MMKTVRDLNARPLATVPSDCTSSASSASKLFGCLKSDSVLTPRLGQDLRSRQKKVLTGEADLHVEQAGHIAVCVTDDRELQVDIANLIDILHPTVMGLKAAATLERICGG